MTSSALPVACGLALTAMSAAVASHWWSVRHFVSAIDHPPTRPLAIPVPAVVPAAVTPRAPAAAPQAIAKTTNTPPVPSTRQSEFYDALIRRIEQLQNQNRDLVDQVAATNRDLMQLEFRVDTHSSQFRPLPVKEEPVETTFDDGPGVLPPRAAPVDLPPFE